ncbi:MAG TPA: murein biosynthesis integral membrane protein MurJ [Vicinamibacterales bacterium]|nr:murein biosynthesis integral membrane protein MurJ [Vicinamibacterales bacterium]
MPLSVKNGLRRVARPDVMVGAGILASRLTGLVRVSAFSYFFGLESDAADAFNAAFKIPNLLQNLFGEGALSGSFIPVHAALLARGDERSAAQTARTVFALLMFVISVLVLLGVLATPVLVDAIAPGFEGAKRDLAVRLVRILFPGAGILVASAWCLGVLNSHGKFLLSYTAPVAWNVAMIATLVVFGPGRHLDSLSIYLAWGSVVGSFLQFAVQAPLAWNLSRDGGRLALSEPVRQTVRNFMPVVVSRGAVQLTSYVDILIASWLPTGAVTGLTNAQLLYTLPVSLFGISISAAELPALSGDAARASTDALRARIDSGLQRLAFFVVPSAVAFVALGDVLSAALLQRGRFRPQDSLYVWGILAGSSIGLLATTMARLYSVAHYALGDTRTPLRYAIVRLSAVTSLGYVCAILLPPYLGIAREWGAAGLTASAGISGWIEFALLRRSINRRIGHTGLPGSYTARLWIAAIAAAGVAWIAKIPFRPTSPLLRASAVLPAFGLTFLALAWLLHVPLATRRRASLR